LPFDARSLKGISEKLTQSHWENNYGGAVKALNTVRSRLAQALNDPNTPPYIYNGLKREQLIRTGSVVLHEFTLPTWEAMARRVASCAPGSLPRLELSMPGRTNFARSARAWPAGRAGWCSDSTRS
jgi:hypothetical protein